jgi:hypothetical protein
MKQLLDNPNTMSKLEVIRALKIRQIYNGEDLPLMWIATIIILSVIAVVGIAIITRELARKDAYPVAASIVATICIIFTLWVLSTITTRYFQFSHIGGISPHQWNLQRVFYLCDGMIIMLAYIIGVSYEIMNVVLFGLIQPLLILILAIIVLRYQSKHLHWTS